MIFFAFYNRTHVVYIFRNYFTFYVTTNRLKF